MLERSIIDLSGELAAAKAERGRLAVNKGEARQQLVSGAADLRAPPFMAERTAKQEQERKAEQARQAAELEQRRNALLE